MKRVDGQHPYHDYYLYVVFHNKEGRRMANLIPKDKNSGLKRTTISYSRYIMSVHLGMILNKDEHVDHIDNDKTNDDISNLQILTLAENNIKASKLRGKKMVKLKCPQCSIEFVKEYIQTHLSKKGKYTGCSRKCSTTFGATIQHNPNDISLLKRINENVIEVFKLH